MIFLTSRKALPFTIIATMTLITIGFVMTIPSAYAETITISPKYNAVLEYNDTKERILTFENEDVVIPVSVPDLNLIAIGNSTFEYGYDLLMGPRSNTTGYITNVVFGLDKMPKSNFFTDISIDSIQLQELVYFVPHYSTGKKIYLSLHTCTNSSWYNPLETELHKMEETKQKVDKKFEKQTGIPIRKNTQLNYDNYYKYRELFLDSETFINDTVFEWKKIDEQPCEISMESSNFFVVEKSDLPKVYVSDVTNNVMDALNETLSDITFIINADSVPEEIPEGESYTSTSILGLVSFEDTKNSLWGVSKSAMPTLIITYTSTPTLLSTLSEPSTMFTIIPVVIPVMIWFYRKEIRKFLKGRKHHRAQN